MCIERWFSLLCTVDTVNTRYTCLLSPAFKCGQFQDHFTHITTLCTLTHVQNATRVYGHHLHSQHVSIVWTALIMRTQQHRMLMLPVWEFDINFCSGRTVELSPMSRVVNTWHARCLRRNASRSAQCMDLCDGAIAYISSIFRVECMIYGYRIAISPSLCNWIINTLSVWMRRIVGA